jgi:hypothetical protein
VQARIITSGVGDWRYFDCVAFRAGKLEALEYVRTMYNVPHSRCVAAGDSCNDILMLEGRNHAIVVNNAQVGLCLCVWLCAGRGGGGVAWAACSGPAAVSCPSCGMRHPPPPWQRRQPPASHPPAARPRAAPQAELLEWLVLQPQDDQRVVYSDTPLAAGIMEGLARLGLY